MSLLDELKVLGVNTEEGLDRVMGDTDLYEMMLGMFIDSVEGSPVKAEDFENSDIADVIERVHMLKGVTGNLAIAPLFDSYTEVLGLLRGGKIEEAQARFKKLLPVQDQVLMCIKRHKNGE